MDQQLLRQAEDAGLNASAPPQQLWIDGWLVRFSPGKAKRARCINAVAPGRRPVDDKLRECEAIYREAGLPMLVRVTPFSEPEALDAELQRRGWQRFDDTRVMVLTHVADALAAQVGSARPLLAGLSVRRADAAEFAATIGRLRASSPGQVQAHAARLQAMPVATVARVWHEDGQVVACGLLARQGRWVGLYDISVAPAYRNRGIGRALCLDLLGEALQAGAASAYLQVDAHNLPARAVYRRLGFAEGFGYHYRSPEPPQA